MEIDLPRDDLTKLVMGLELQANGKYVPMWLEVDDRRSARVHVDGFLIYGYDPDLTMNDAAQYIVMPTGSTNIDVGNLGSTGQHIRVAWGEDEAEAADNLNIAAGAATTGKLIPPIADAGSAAFRTLGRPPGMNVLAICNAVADHAPVVTVSPGR